MKTTFLFQNFAPLASSGILSVDINMLHFSRRWSMWIVKILMSSYFFTKQKITACVGQKMFMNWNYVSNDWTIIKVANIWGQFHKPICALRQSFDPYAKILRHNKASQKLHIGHKRMALGTKQFMKSTPG